MRVTRFLILAPALIGLAGSPATAAAHTAAAHRTSGRGGSAPTASQSSGGAGIAGPDAPISAPSTPAHPTVPGLKARIIRGVAYAPSLAPIQVQRAIWAGNKIRHKPYIYGGGHAVWNDAGYDCSGSVSYILHAAGLLKTSMDSSGFMGWGGTGLGQWMTVYSNPGHAMIQIAGIRLDTSSEGDPNPAPGTGPRWRPLLSDTSAFSSTHPVGF